MKIKKTIVMLVLLLSLMFGMISNVYATNIENNEEEKLQTSIESNSNTEKYKKVLNILGNGRISYGNVKKVETPEDLKFPRTGIEKKPLLIVADVCFVSAAIGSLALIVIILKRK